MVFNRFNCWESEDEFFSPILIVNYRVKAVRCAILSDTICRSLKIISLRILKPFPSIISLSSVIVSSHK